MTKTLRRLGFLAAVAPMVWALAPWITAYALGCDPGDDPSQARCIVLWQDVGLLLHGVFWPSMLDVPLLGLVLAAVLFVISLFALEKNAA